METVWVIKFEDSVLGVCSTKEKAIQAAKRILKAELDDEFCSMFAFNPDYFITVYGYKDGHQIDLLGEYMDDYAD